MAGQQGDSGRPGVVRAHRRRRATRSAPSGPRGDRDLTVYYSPPQPRARGGARAPVSPVRLFTLIGGLTGCTAGFAMTDLDVHDWPLLVGGKPIAPIPPFVVIGFELTILLGALSTVVGVILLSMLLRHSGRHLRPALQRRPDRHLRARRARAGAGAREAVQGRRGGGGAACGVAPVAHRSRSPRSRCRRRLRLLVQHGAVARPALVRASPGSTT